MKDPQGDRPTELVSRWVAIVGGALSLLVAVLSLSVGVTRDRSASAVALTVAAFLTFGVVSAYLPRSRSSPGGARRFPKWRRRVHLGWAAITVVSIAAAAIP